MDPLAAAKAAVQGVSPGQVAASPVAGVNTAVAPFAPASTNAPAATSWTPLINNLMSPQFAAGPAAAAAGAVTGQAANDVNNFYAERQNAMMAQSQAQQALNVRKLPNPDGSYQFIDGTGKPMTLSQYMQVSGESLNNALKGATDAQSQQAVKDYGTMQSLVNAWNDVHTASVTPKGTSTQGNQTLADALTSANKVASSLGYGSSQALSSDLQAQGINSPADLMNQYLKYYSNLMQGGQANVYPTPAMGQTWPTPPEYYNQR